MAYYPYNIYNGMSQPYNPMPQSQGNVLPPQQVLQANGKASIDAIRLSPNSSVLVMDTTAPVVWLCASDSIGTVTKTPYDIALHVENTDADTIEQRLEKAEKSISKIMEALNNDKPDNVSIKHKPAAKLNSTD